MWGRVAGRVQRRHGTSARRLRVPGVAVAVAVALAVAACAGGSGVAGTPGATAPPGATPPRATAPPGATAIPGGGDVKAFIDLAECENAGGSGTAAGTIENQGADAAAYRITVGFFDAAGTKLGEGTADTTVAAPGAAAGWTVTTDGLGDAEATCRTVDVTMVVGAGQGSASAGTAVPTDEYPCTLISEAAVEQLAGNSLEPGDANTIHHDENGVLWTAAECAWLSQPGPAVEVDLEVSGVDGFPSGTVGCPPLDGSPVPVDGLGSTATWSWIDPGTELTVGTLRICSAGALVDVRVSGPGGEAALRAVATGVATEVIAAL